MTSENGWAYPCVEGLKACRPAVSSSGIRTLRTILPRFPDFASTGNPQRLEDADAKRPNHETTLRFLHSMGGHDRSALLHRSDSHLVCRSFPFRSLPFGLCASPDSRGWYRGPLAGFSNRAGLRFWLIKHGSSDGPATVLDGILIGAACGMGTVLIPPLTSLIASHHPQEARSLIIVLWLVGMAVGCLIGGTLAAIGRRHIRGGKPVKGE